MPGVSKFSILFVLVKIKVPADLFNTACIYNLFIMSLCRELLIKVLEYTLLIYTLTSRDIFMVHISVKSN